MGRHDEADGSVSSSSRDGRSLDHSAGDAGATHELVRLLEAAALAEGDLGEYACGAETARIAIEVHRGLVEREGTSVDPGLARAQVGLGVLLFLAGRDGYLDAVVEGGRLYRELARGSPETFAASERVVADVASVLDNSIRWDLERAAKREDGAEAPVMDVATAVFLLSKVRALHDREET